MESLEEKEKRLSDIEIQRKYLSARLDPGTAKELDEEITELNAEIDSLKQGPTATSEASPDKNNINERVDPLKNNKTIEPASVSDGNDNPGNESVPMSVTRTLPPPPSTSERLRALINSLNND